MKKQTNTVENDIEKFQEDLFSKIEELLSMAINSLGVNTSPSSVRKHCRGVMFPNDPSHREWFWDNTKVLEMKPLDWPAMGVLLTCFIKKGEEDKRNEEQT